MDKPNLNPEIMDKINYLYKPGERHHERISLILTSDLSNEVKQNLILAEIAVNLYMIGSRL